MRHKSLNLARKTLAAAALIVIFGTGVSAETEKILHTFSGISDATQPQAGLILDSKGNLYGVGFGGGANGIGAVFELTLNSNGTWTEQVIYSFAQFGAGDGAFPFGGLVLDSTGNLYGLTQSGGANFNGTVYEVSPSSNGTWSEKVLYSFAGGADGGNPAGALAIDAAGNLFGTTGFGGKQGFGTVFELEAGTGGTWSKKTLHNFTGGNDGSLPYDTQLAFDSAGRLYGQTFNGGEHDYGVVFQLTAGSGGIWTEKVVHAFTGGAGGATSGTAVAVDKADNVYVSAQFSVWQFAPNSNGAWTANSLHEFVGGTDGATAESGLVLDATGNVYGTTYSGGLHRGTVFELSPARNGKWIEKILHKFTGGSDGNFPQVGSLAVDAAGNVYGTTPTGGTSNSGVVYEVIP